MPGAADIPPGPLHLAPVGAVGWEDGLAARRGGRPVQRVGRCAPDGVVRRGTMRLQRGLVLVDLEEVIGVLVLIVLQHVEPEAAGLVPLGTERVHLDRLENRFRWSGFTRTFTQI